MNIAHLDLSAKKNGHTNTFIRTLSRTDTSQPMQVEIVFCRSAHDSFKALGPAKLIAAFAFAKGVSVDNSSRIMQGKTCSKNERGIKLLLTNGSLELVLQVLVDTGIVAYGEPVDLKYFSKTQSGADQIEHDCSVSASQ